MLKNITIQFLLEQLHEQMNWEDDEVVSIGTGVCNNKWFYCFTTKGSDGIEKEIRIDKYRA